jgi:NAD(P)-dependent dehydrogenase (short-subunit alcohol dehydrogenase family)
MSSKTVLLLGAGKMVGEAIAQHFFQNGYKVALASRSGNFPWDTKNSYLHVKADFENPSSIQGVFDEVKSKYGVPNVVVYNSTYPNPQLMSWFQRTKIWI